MPIGGTAVSLSRETAASLADHTQWVRENFGWLC